MAKWNERPSWTDFKDINNGQNFSRILTPEDLNALAENIYYLYSYGGGVNSAIPIEVSTEAEMTELLKIGQIGGVYKYTGTTGVYENGALYVLEASQPITFTIDETPYTAEEGRRWREWLESDYNTGGFWEDGSDYVYSSKGERVYLDDTRIIATMQILANASYYSREK